jgi:hypothetical protein
MNWGNGGTTASRVFMGKKTLNILYIHGFEFDEKLVDCHLF